MDTMEAVKKQSVSKTADQEQAKAKVARAAQRNKPTLKDINQPADPPAAQPAKPERKKTFADQLDELVQAGGKWEDLIAKAAEAAKVANVNGKVTKGFIKAHINYRIKRNADYLKGLEMTDDGIKKG